ncbi:MAG: nuclear transport factor 2 family protein [Pseudomonadota bacterium]
MDDVARLAAKDEIRDLVLRYCRAIDRRNFDALPPLFSVDALDDHGAYYQGPAAGFIEALPEIMAPMKVTSHQVFNHLIALEGDHAEGEVYVQAFHHYDDENGDPIDATVGGRYLDKYCREEGVWRFCHRKIVLDWNAIGPSRCDWDDPSATGTPRGSDGLYDPSSDFFKLI